MSESQGVLRADLQRAHTHDTGLAESGVDALPIARTLQGQGSGILRITFDQQGMCDAHVSESS